MSSEIYSKVSKVGRVASRVSRVNGATGNCPMLNMATKCQLEMVGTHQKGSLKNRVLIEEFSLSGKLLCTHDVALNAFPRKMQALLAVDSAYTARQAYVITSEGYWFAMLTPKEVKP